MLHDFLLKDELFDTDILACEDFDLWLCLTSRHQVGLLDEFLLIRNGGHEDQLSFKYPVMDRFRIYSMLKVLKSCSLDKEESELLEKELVFKINILLAGAKKRGINLSDLSLKLNLFIDGESIDYKSFKQDLLENHLFKE